MSARFADSPLLICGATSFLAFLVVEPLRPEIFSYFADDSVRGWIAFDSLRFVLLIFTVVSFILASPRLGPVPSRTVPMPEKGNDPLLTLRVFAFVLVVAGHGLVLIFMPSGVYDLLNDGSRIWLAMGSPWAGVWVFFVLSGYLMAKGFYRGKYGLSRGDILAFYRNRILRIVPIYYLALFLTALFFSPDIFQPSNWWEIIALAAFSQQNGAPHSIVGALWSIQMEMAFYAVVPLLFFAIHKLTSRYPLWLLVSVFLALGWAYRSCVMNVTDGEGWVDRVYIPLIGNLDLFLLGMCANWALPSAQRWLKSAPTLSIGLALLVPLYVVSTYYFCQSSFGIGAERFKSEIQISGPTLVGLTAFLVILLFEHHTALKMKAAFIPRKIVRGTQMFGILTYALYAWHEPVLLHLRTAAAAELTVQDAVLWLLFGLAITTAIAFLTYRMFEAPFEARRTVVPPVVKAS